ncbi:MAG: hypothetical protein WD603_01290 [Patescibacteria group bacterium]
MSDTEPRVSFGISRDTATEGRHAVTSPDGGTFHPTHEDPDERERFLEFFGGLELSDKVAVLDGIGRAELTDQLQGIDPSSYEWRLDEVVARWIEENERFVQYREGSRARMARNPRLLTGDEGRSFKEGFLDRLAKEAHDSWLHTDLGETEARLADLWRSLKNPEASSLERARRSGWSYFTVVTAPEEGRPPEWVRTAWEGVSIPMAPDRDGDEQDFRDGHALVWVDDAIPALAAEGKNEAVWWWIDHYPDFQGQMLAFKLEDVELDPALDRS